MTSIQQALIEQIHTELGTNEDTELLLDWLQDAWGTLHVLRERFGEEHALRLYTASGPLPEGGLREAVRGAAARRSRERRPSR